MAYENFTIERVTDEFALDVQDKAGLFVNVQPLEPSARLQSLLADFMPLASAIGTEKARSEFIIAPILAEVKKLTGTSLFSGNRFEVDKEKGLTGYCDFIFSASPNQLTLSAPILTLVEAKNDNLNSGFGQCMAEMVAAQLYNQHRKIAITTIYGCVTTGSVWRFLKLTDQQILLDSAEYYLDQLATILGILVAGLNN